MKNRFLLSAILSGALLTGMHASTDSGYQPATVVSIESHETRTNYDGGDPSDAPLQPTVNSYEIGIRLGETVYQTSYESAFDGLPSVFTLNHTVQVDLKKHVMYVELPGDRAAKMAIESRAGVNSTSSMSGN